MSILDFIREKRTPQRLAYDWGILAGAGIGTLILASRFWTWTGIQKEGMSCPWFLYLIFFIGFGMVLEWFVKEFYQPEQRSKTFWRRMLGKLVKTYQRRNLRD